MSRKVKKSELKTRDHRVPETRRPLTLASLDLRPKTKFICLIFQMPNLIHLSLFRHSPVIWSNQFNR
jgi:hypothetical protein